MAGKWRARHDEESPGRVGTEPQAAPVERVGPRSRVAARIRALMAARDLLTRKAATPMLLFISEKRRAHGQQAKL